MALGAALTPGNWYTVRVSDVEDVAGNPIEVNSAVNFGYVVEPEEAWRRIKTRSNDPRFLGVVKALATWREEEAQSRNAPRGPVTTSCTSMPVMT